MISEATRATAVSPWRRWTRRLRRTGWNRADRRVPFLQQMSAVECGTACLAMILSYFGRKTSVAEARDLCPAGTQGLTARSLAMAARAASLQVRPVSCEPDKLGQLPMPAILHWNFEHFVVLEAWSPTQAVVVDPARGRRTLTAAELDEGFTGVVLTFTPAASFERRKRTGGLSLRSYFGDLLRTPGLRPVIAQMVAASVLLQLLGLVVPLVTKVVVDHLLPLREVSLFPLLAAGAAAWIAGFVVISYLRSVLLIYLQGRLDSSIMVGFFDHLLRLPFGFFQQRTTGDLLMRMASNTVIRETLTTQTLALLLDGGLVLLYLFLLVWIAPSFGLLVLGLGVLQVLILVATRRPVHRLMQEHLASQAEAQSYALESLKAVATLKTAGAEDQALHHWSDLFFRQLNVSLRRSHLSALVQVATRSVQTAAPLLLLGLGAYLVLEGTMTLGTLLALMAIAASFLAPLGSIVVSGQRLQLVGAHLERIKDVLEADPEQSAGTGRVVDELAGRVEVQGLSFRYDDDSPWVLRDISFTVEPGQKVAIVGATGSGKSTLIHLLLGLYRPSTGEILYDEQPVHRLDLQSLRRNLGVVLQEPQVFAGSIRENLTLNAPGTPMKQVMEVARMAGIHDDIARMPMAYETRVSEGGQTLSGGQRQRLCLARALLHRPPVLFLDEATSHLDQETERRVAQNLEKLACSRLVVAHRLSTVRDADRILVLEGGRLVEQGNHDELLSLHGVYSRLVDGGLEPAEGTDMGMEEAAEKGAASDRSSSGRFVARPVVRAGDVAGPSAPHEPRAKAPETGG